jgi:fructose-1,6-bisphosphatase/inositol monophosphatase family enzyme
VRYKSQIGEKGARAWVCDASDGTRQFSAPLWAVMMVVKEHNELETIKEAPPGHVTLGVVREVFSRRLNLHYDQRMYSWHEIQDALEEIERREPQNSPTKGE